MSQVHDHYVLCDCGASYSNTIEKCRNCGKPNPELPTLNAKAPEESESPASEIPNTEPVPTLNAKEPGDE